MVLNAELALDCSASPKPFKYELLILPKLSASVEICGNNTDVIAVVICTVLISSKIEFDPSWLLAWVALASGIKLLTNSGSTLMPFLSEF